MGLPYFALSATSPLVQAWFSRSSPGRSPYRLYALSNIGSLAALLSYPFFFEPALALRQQSVLWSGAFVLYGALCPVSLACLWQLRHRQPAMAPNDLAASTLPRRPADLVRPHRLDRLAGLRFADAFGRHQPHVSGRGRGAFLWILPLTLYLLSFIITFDHERWYIRPAWTVVALVALLAVAGIDYLKRQTNSEQLTLPQEITLNSLVLFCACMVCHGEVARPKARSAPSHRVLPADCRRRRAGRSVRRHRCPEGLHLLF